MRCTLCRFVRPLLVLFTVVLATPAPGCDDDDTSVVIDAGPLGERPNFDTGPRTADTPDAGVDGGP